MAFLGQEDKETDPEMAILFLLVLVQVSGNAA
jgi:hypothetical protein